MKTLISGVLLSTLLFTAACGDDDDGPTGNSGNGSVSATFTTAGTSNFTGSLATKAVHTSGVLAIGATQTAGAGSVRQININLTGVEVAGTFSVASGQTSSIIYTETSGATISSWTTSLLGGTGSVTITSLTASRAVGTFTNLTLQPSPGTAATGTRTVSSGTFDVDIAG